MPSILVEGMHCQNCANAVTKALNSIVGVKNTTVNLESKKVSWDDDNASIPVDIATIKKAILDIGFEPKD